MVHLLINGTPLCQQLHERCQYSTRREAFDALVILETRFPKKDISIAKGYCPTNFQEVKS